MRPVAVGPRSHLDRAAKMCGPGAVRAARPRKTEGSPLFPDKDEVGEWSWRSPGPAEPVPARGTRYVLTPPPPPRPKEAPCTKKFRVATQVPMYPRAYPQVAEDWVLEPAGRLDNGVEVLDLCVPGRPARRLQCGRWSLTEGFGSGESWFLSRLVGLAELDRNSGRIEGMGMCGYLALEWASRVGFEADPVGLSLRDPGAAEQLAEFVDRISVGTEGQVRDKLDRVVLHLRGSLSPWLTPRSDGLWLGVADLPCLSLWFPLVLWGGDVGGGWRRVTYPSGQAASVGLGRELASVSAQIVLDSDHFHPLDEAFGSIGPLCDWAAARVDAMKAALGTAVRVGEELAGVDPAKRGAAFLGVVDGVCEAADSVSSARGRGWI